MSVNLIFKIAAVGILVSILSQVLKHSGREEQAFLTSLAGLLIVLFWIVPYIYELFDSIHILSEDLENVDRGLSSFGGEMVRFNQVIRQLPQGFPFLLLDEPCSALDVKSTQVIEQLLLKLKENYTIVIVTHNLFQARRIADDCIFMLNGELWEQNTTEELFNNPERQETKDYLHGAYA